MTRKSIRILPGRAPRWRCRSVQPLRVTIVDQVLDVGAGRSAEQQRAIELVSLAATRLGEPGCGWPRLSGERLGHPVGVVVAGAVMRRGYPTNDRDRVTKRCDVAEDTQPVRYQRIAAGTLQTRTRSGQPRPPDVCAAAGGA